MVDLLFLETNNGGDLVLGGKDLLQTEGLETALYLAMFGDDGTGFWGNYMLPEAQQFVSRTQLAIQTNSLTSAGRLNILEAVTADMAFLNELPDVISWTADVAITGVNKITITINVNGKPFQYTYNSF